MMRVSLLALSSVLLSASRAMATKLILEGYSLEEVLTDDEMYLGSDGKVIHSGDHYHDPCAEFIGEVFTLEDGADQGRGFLVINDCQAVECTKWTTESGSHGGKTVIYDLVEDEDATETWDVLESATCDYVGKFFHQGNDCEISGTPGSIACSEGDDEEDYDPKMTVSSVVMDTAEKVGLSIGVIAAIAAIALFLFYCLCCRRRKKSEEQQSKSANTAAAAVAGSGGKKRGGWFGSKKSSNRSVSTEADEEQALARVAPAAKGSKSAVAAGAAGKKNKGKEQKKKSAEQVAKEWTKSQPAPSKELKKQDSNAKKSLFGKKKATEEVETIPTTSQIKPRGVIVPIADEPAESVKDDASKPKRSWFGKSKSEPVVAPAASAVESKKSWFGKKKNESPQQKASEPVVMPKIVPEVKKEPEKAPKKEEVKVAEKPKEVEKKAEEVPKQKNESVADNTQAVELTCCGLRS